MKLRNGFVSNSSSSSFIIADNKKIEKVKDILNKDEDKIMADYYEFEGKLYTSIIPDCVGVYSEIYELSFEAIDTGHSYPYNEEDFIEFEGDRGVSTVYIPKNIITCSEKTKFYNELKALDNTAVNDIIKKYKRVFEYEN